MAETLQEVFEWLEHTLPAGPSCMTAEGEAAWLRNAHRYGPRWRRRLGRPRGTATSGTSYRSGGPHSRPRRAADHHAARGRVTADSARTPEHIRSVRCTPGVRWGAPWPPVRSSR